MSRGSHFCLLAVCGLVLAQATASLALRSGFALTAVSDLVQSALLLAGSLVCVANALAGRGRTRLFWLLMSLGMAFWFAYQTVLWTYFEVFLRQEVPDVFWGDVVLFLHIVPMMAALVLQPHAQQDERTSRLGSLDFALLLVWWLYLYVFAVIPWQHAVTDVATYQHNLNSLYLAEKIVFLAGLALVWFRSGGVWKVIYANLFAANVTYALSSYLVIWAIEKRAYYSGSLYDIPLVVSMAWMAGIGILTFDQAPQQQVRREAQNHGVWVARLAMGAIFSLPLFAGWSLLDGSTPPSVRSFRLVLTLGSMVLMGAMVFAKQHILDRELLGLLRSSRNSYESLTRLQEQLLQSEKLASLGQLVGGAAHEINNPLTAMLGYSDLLGATVLTADQREIAEKIRHQVRRTQSLVSSLLRFAKQVPGEKTLININALAQTAIQITQARLQAHDVKLRISLAADLPPVHGDSNQLLQVCVHIINNGLNLAEGHGGAVTITTLPQQNMVVLQFGANSPGPEAENLSLDQAEAEATSLGMSACAEIIRQHDGKMCYGHHAGGRTFRIELPTHSAAQARERSERDAERAAATLTLPVTP